MASAAAGSWHRAAQNLIWMCWPQNLSGVHEMRECAHSQCAQHPLLSSSPDPLVQFPCLSLPVDPADSGLRAAGLEQALPGKDRCKCSGFHMKRSCLQRASPLWAWSVGPAVKEQEWGRRVGSRGGAATQPSWPLPSAPRQRPLEGLLNWFLAGTLLPISTVMGGTGLLRTVLFTDYKHGLLHLIPPKVPWWGPPIYGGLNGV